MSTSVLQATNEEIQQLLKNTKTIAVVGLSDNPARPSHEVAAYLLRHGYRIIPVNPSATEILGQKSYASLHAIPERVDIVDIFRNVEAIPGLVEEALKLNPRCVWMQLGLSHEQAAGVARDAGILVVMNKCIKIEHSRLL
ncbi:MAG: CoA-binding protein [SAR324 cluster bacterium]|nr:CoA-binding protein [SAR324 cluster bacterium]